MAILHHPTILTLLERKTPVTRKPQPQLPKPIPWESCDYDPARCYGTVGAVYPEDLDILYEEYADIGVILPE